MKIIKNKLKKIFIIGATGFIGSCLTRRLSQKGFEIGISKRETSDAWRIRDFTDDLKVFNLNLKDRKKVSQTISDFAPEVIFNLATYYSPDHQSHEILEMFDTNVLGTINLLEASKNSSVELFVNTSSCFVYGETKNKINEDAQLNPLNLYALTKIQAEQACSFYSKKYALKTVTFRLFPPYGPADHPRRLIPYVITTLLKNKKPLLTSGQQRWDFVYVEDIVDAFERLLFFDSFPQNHEVFNIGAGEAVSVKEVVSHIVKKIRPELKPEWGALPTRKSEVWFTCADIKKAESYFGWYPKTRILSDGLEKTINWYENFLKLGE